MSQTNTIGRLTRAIQVIPSDSVEIPHPAYKVMTSTTTSTAATSLIDNTVNFQTMYSNNEFAIGDIIYDTTNADAAIIESIDGPNTLGVSPFAIASGATYTIYKAGKNNGCILLLPTMSRIRVCAVGAPDESLKWNINPGSSRAFPLQVTKVFNRDTTIVSGVIIACFY
tara:strand:- start:5499 stop:6005 length:507 start_codon:yes stop_codon:yes gene_type:complete